MSSYKVGQNKNYTYWLRKGKLSTWGWDAHFPHQTIGQTYFSVVWSILQILHNKPVTFPSLPIHIYIPGSWTVILMKCLTEWHNTLTVKGLKPTTLCLYTHHWSPRPHVPTYLLQHYNILCYTNMVIKTSQLIKNKLGHNHRTEDTINNFFLNFWKINFVNIRNAINLSGK